MPEPHATSRDATSAPASRRWIARALFAAAALLVALVAAGYAFLSGQAGLDFVSRELVMRSGGALEIDGAAGSLFDTVRIRRVAWRGPDTQLSADEVALSWSPTALLSRGIVVRGLGAQRLTLAMNAGAGDVPLPRTMALPIEVRIEHIGVGEIDWRVGTNRGAIRGLAFGYAGGATGHQVSDVSFVAAMGAITGNATIGADAPFPIAGRIEGKGDAALAGADAGVVLGGSLAALTLDGSGKVGAARFRGRASLAPLAAAPLLEAALDASGIDLAAWNATLPATELTLALEARPADGAIAGAIDAVNATPGSIDGGRIPLRTLAARFAWRDDALALDSIAATLAGGGTLAGHGRIPLGTAGNAGAWTLDVRDVDLRQLYAPLIATRLSGKLVADLDREQQRIRGDIADRSIIGGVALDFAAVVAKGSVVVDGFRVRSGKGELAGRGRIALSGERAFELDATALRLDPASYGAFPAGALDGRVVASGTLKPAWRVRADVALARGSRLAGVAVAGTARGAFAPDSIRDLALDLAAGRSNFRATSETAERIAVVLEAPDLAELAPLFPAGFPSPISGALRGKATIAGAPAQIGIDLEAGGERLKLPGGIAFDTLGVRANVAPGTTADARDDLLTRALRIDVTATGFVAPAATFGTMRAGLNGTLAQHALTLAMKGADFDFDGSAHGGLDLMQGPAGVTATAWNGTLDTMENRGPWALRLAAPAVVQLARSRVRVGATQLAVADGSVRLAEFAWDDGRITTSGTFTAVPLGTAARLAGAPLPFGSTVTLGGEWSIAAAPRLTGNLTIRREAGDFFFTRGGAPDAGIAAGITTLAAVARFTDGAVDATASLRSARGDAADAKLAIGTVADAPDGRISPAAPLDFSLTGDVPSLQVLQPWIGSAAVVSGRAHLDVAARGTVGNAALSGALKGEGLRLDAPQYGLHFTDGRLAARAADGRVVIDEIVLGAGAGTFRASGEIAGLAPGGERPVARLAWRAERFRAFNRPDLRLVVGGEGTATAEGGKITISGKLRADEGSIVYLATPDATLGDDVVVKGRPRPGAETRRAENVPLAIDLALDLGDRLTFSGEGLETGLSGVVQVTTSPRGLLGRGTIRTVRGTYFAFGQQLAIDRGRLVFDGRLDNPGLDIVALRKNLAVEAGVTITGTVKVPVIQLTSNPPVPDSEKLSWLVLGQALDGTSGGDLAALQAASAVLLGSHGRPVSATIAQRIGLDDISLRSASATQGGAQPGAPGAEGQVVAVGKRLTDRLSLVYEQGLSVATNALRLEYELTRSLRLRAEAGTVSGLGLYFRRSFD